MKDYLNLNIREFRPKAERNVKFKKSGKTVFGKFFIKEDGTKKIFLSGKKKKNNPKVLENFRNEVASEDEALVNFELYPTKS